MDDPHGWRLQLLGEALVATLDTDPGGRFELRVRELEVVARTAGDAIVRLRPGTDVDFDVEASGVLDAEAVAAALRRLRRRLMTGVATPVACV